jgi:hypothetical protein
MSKENINQVVEETQPQPQTQTEPVKVDFMSSDVAIVLNIIDVASARGTFRGPEMKGIGEFYEKLQGLIPKKASE